MTVRVAFLQPFLRAGPEAIAPEFAGEAAAPPAAKASDREQVKPTHVAHGCDCHKPEHPEKRGLTGRLI